jgi:hypothetical protein
VYQLAGRGRTKKNNNQENLDIQAQITPEKFVETFSRTIFDTLRTISEHPFYTPFFANSLVKDININPHKPKSDEITKWLEHPAEYEDQLSRLSQYLEGVVMQYERTIYHFVSNLDFNYYIYPITQVPNPKEDSEAFKTYRNSKKKALDWLRKFRLKEQLFNITLGVVREGGKFYYVRESNDFIDLQEMSSEWSTIDGRTSLGWTYSFNMAFFLRAPQSLQSFAPEFQEWFKDFYKEWEKNRNIVYFKQMPPEKSAVFLFDDTRAARLNPLRAIFKDALDVVEYKQLLKTKAMLDTWKLIYLEIPKDKDGKPTLDFKLAAQWIAQAQASLPYGAVAFSSPMAAQELKVSDNQFINILGSLTNQKFWENIGISPLAYGSSDGKSVASVKSSNITDVQFINHLYNIYMKFINHQLSMNTGSVHKFGIRIFGDAFSRQEIVDRYRNSSTMGVGKKEYLASLGREPWETELNMDDQTLFDWDTSKFIPFATSFTQSGDQGGRPQLSESQLGEAGDVTRSAGSNEEKITD